MLLTAVKWHCKCTHIVMAHIGYIYSYMKNGHVVCVYILSLYKKQFQREYF